MILPRPSSERGTATIDWLDTRYTFSFAYYHDPDWMGFRSLRVINEDRVAPASGFPSHPHRDMEILTVVLSGALEHKDSLGTGSTIRPGEVQRMTAGSGIVHSEFNPSKKEETHLLQIWILPERRNLEPGYEQKSFPFRDGLTLIASPDGADGSLTIHQDARVYRGRGPAELRGRHVWVQVFEGSVSLNGRELSAGDGAGVWGEPVRIAGNGQYLLFDLA